MEADTAAAGDQPQDGQAQGGFAGAAFTHDAEGLALRQAEVDAVHGFDVVDGAAQQAFLDGKPHAQVFDFQQGVAHGVVGGAPLGSALISIWV